MAGFTNCLANISSFLVVKTYPTLASPDHLGFQGTMWFYASVCLLNVFIGIFILPETKGKRLDEITKKFTRNGSSKTSHSKTESFLN
jgi:putative MFS transporter